MKNNRVLSLTFKLINEKRKKYDFMYKFTARIINFKVAFYSTWGTWIILDGILKNFEVNSENYLKCPESGTNIGMKLKFELYLSK